MVDQMRAPTMMMQQAPGGAYAPPPPDTPLTRQKIARARPFALPPSPQTPPPAPPVAQIVAWKNERVARWQDRNQRMADDERLYLMKQAQTTKRSGKGGDELIVSNYIRSIIDRTAYKVSRRRKKITVTPRAPDPPHIAAAQASEDFLYDTMRAAGDRHASALNNALEYDEAWYAALRGWLVSRVYLDYDADAENPVCVTLYDPMLCYPRPGKVGIGTLRDMILFEQTDVQGFLAANPKYIGHPHFAGVNGAPKGDNDVVTWTWYEDAYWSVLIVDDGVVLDQRCHNYGFCPWVVDLSGGPASHTKEARSQRGAGMAASIRHIYAYGNRFYSQMATGLARHANPPAKYPHNGSEPVERVDLGPGARIPIDTSKGQDVVFLDTVPPPDTSAMMQAVIERELARGAVPDFVWGDPSGLSNGFQQATAIEAAMDALYPVSECIEQHYQRRNRLVLALVLVAERQGTVTQGGPDPLMALMQMAQQDGDGTDQEGMGEDLGEGVPEQPFQGFTFERPTRAQPSLLALLGVQPPAPPRLFEVLTPDEVRLSGIESRVKLRKLTATDQLQITQMASMAVQSGLSSMRRVREDMLDYDDPDAVNAEVIYDQLFKDPEVMRAVFIPRVLRDADPELYQQYMALQAAHMAPPQGAAPPPGPPGVSNAQLPAALQAVQGIGAGDPQALLAQLAGVAQAPNAQNMPPPAG